MRAGKSWTWTQQQMAQAPLNAAQSRAWRPLADVDPRACHPLYAAILAQLPEQLAEQLTVEVSTDSYYIATTAKFTTKNGREFHARLRPGFLPDGKPATIVLPPEFLAMMCLAV